MIEPDDLRTLQVEHARLEGRIESLESHQTRMEGACERRAKEHVSREIYKTDKAVVQDSIGRLGERLGGHERDTDRKLLALENKLEDERRGRKEAFDRLAADQKRTRQWVIAQVVIPVAAIVIGLLVGRLL